MKKQQQKELIDEIQTMGNRQLEALKRSISISDVNSYIKDRLMSVVEERENRLVRVGNAMVEMSELKADEI